MFLRSMSRKGNSIDNGAMESVFGRLKAELLALFGKFEAQDFETLEARIEYVIHHWNNDRGIERLGGLSSNRVQKQLAQAREEPMVCKAC